MAMRLPVVLVLALLLTGGLAGCLGGGKEEPAPVVNRSATAATPIVDTGNATNTTTESAMTTMAHGHDYWQGKERLTLIDQDVDVSPQQAVQFTFMDVLRDRNPAVGGASVRLPDGMAVFEGTGKMEITATWSAPTVTGATVRYRTAASTDWSDAKPLTSGQALKLDITPDMTDMPHSKTSRWGFLLTPAQGQVMQGSIHFKVDIIRLRDISLWPGHGLLFAGAHTLTLYDGQASSKHDSAVSALTGFVTGDGASPDDEGVASQKVVPMETMWMTANVTITDASAQVGTVRNVSFLYKAANTNGFRQANLTQGDMEKGIFQFSWPVNMAQTDSPYAKTSQWRYDLLIQTSDPTGVLGNCRGCSDAQVQYKLVVVAYDAAKPSLAAPSAS